MYRTYERRQAIAENYVSPRSPFRQRDHEYGHTFKDVRLLYSTLPLRAPAHYLWLIDIGLPFEVILYAGLILFGYGIIRPLVKEVTWVDLAFIAPFFIGLLKAFWYG